MLNIAGPEYDFGNVVFVVLEECEHRRRGFDVDELDGQLRKTARARLARIRAAYDEFGGSAAYWSSLEAEVMETVMTQYIAAAREMNALEVAQYGVWRGGDPAARLTYTVGGLLLGSFIIALPFVPSIEAASAFALAGLGFFYPELKRWTHERRHFKLLNRLVADSVRYQQNARLHYMTTNDIRESFAVSGSSEESPAEESEAVTDRSLRE